MAQEKLLAAWWWIDRWRKSTAFTDMTLAEQGAYRNLLDELWLRDGVIPDSERILSRICGDALEWPSVRDAVMSHFIKTPDGWINETQRDVYDKTMAIRAARSEAGRRGGIASGEARSRLSRSKPEANVQAKGKANTQANDQAKTNHQSPSLSQSKDQDQDQAPKQTTLSVSATPSPDIERVFDHFRILHPRARLTKKRRTLIAGHLRDGYTVDDLMLALDGLHLDRWHIENGNLTMEYGLRNGDKIDGLMEVASNPSHPKRLNGRGPVLTDKSKRSIEAGIRWIERRGSDE